MNDLLLTLSPRDRQALAEARLLLEHPSLAARLTNVIGAPVEIAAHFLPAGWHDRLHAGAEQAIAKALDTAIASLRSKARPRPRRRFHQLLGAGSGAVGGLLGLPGLAVELPLTTTIMLRSIAAIAHSQGETLDSLDTRLACLEVFALGGRSEEDDATETGYYGVRLALSLSVSRASAHLAEQGLSRQSAPVLANLIASIASRFNATVAQKIAAQLIPVVGALGGAAINTIFIQHFQDTAHGHFTIRRLERQYGPAVVEAAYENLPASSPFAIGG